MRFSPCLRLCNYTNKAQKEGPEVVVHKTGFEKQILWQLPDKGC